MWFGMRRNIFLLLLLLCLLGSLLPKLANAELQNTIKLTSVRWEMHLGRQPSDLAVDEGSGTVYVVDRAAPYLHAVSAVGQLEWTLQLTASVTKVLAAPSIDRLFLFDPGGRVLLVSISSRSVVAELPIRLDSTGLAADGVIWALDPTTSHLYIGENVATRLPDGGPAGSFRVQVFDGIDGTLVALFPRQEEAGSYLFYSATAIAPDEARGLLYVVVSRSFASHIEVFDTTSRMRVNDASGFAGGADVILVDHTTGWLVMAIGDSLRTSPGARSTAQIGDIGKWSSQLVEGPFFPDGRRNSLARSVIDRSGGASYAVHRSRGRIYALSLADGSTLDQVQFTSPPWSIGLDEARRTVYMSEPKAGVVRALGEGPGQ